MAYYLKGKEKPFTISYQEQSHSPKELSPFSRSKKIKFLFYISIVLASQVDLVVKNPPAKAGDVRDSGSIPGQEDPRGGSGNPLQYSCLENPMDRGTWQATVHRVAKTRT